MKKLIILSMILILGLSLIAYAKVTKAELAEEGDQVLGHVDPHENASGFVIINETPKGDTITVVQIQVRDAAPGWTYYVFSGKENRGSFTTNKKGSGSFHLNLGPLDTPLGGRITIRSSDDRPGPPNRNTNVVLQYKFPT